MFFGKREECRPVGAGGVPGTMLAERDISIDQRTLDRRHLSGSEIILAEQFVNWTGADCGHEHAFWVDPTVAL